MNSPSDTMNSNAEEDIVVKESPGFGLKISKDIGEQNICDKTRDIGVYESDGDSFYNTVEHDAKNSVDIETSADSKNLDLINFDQSISQSFGHCYINGQTNIDSNYEPNQTFNTGRVPIVNKHLKVKTADLLSVSDIGGNFSDLSTTTYSDSSTNIPIDDDDFHCTDDLKDNSEESLLETSTITDQKSYDSDSAKQALILETDLKTQESENILSNNSETSNKSIVEEYTSSDISQHELNINKSSLEQEAQFNETALLCTSINKDQTFPEEKLETDLVESPKSDSSAITIEDSPIKNSDVNLNITCNYIDEKLKIPFNNTETENVIKKNDSKKDNICKEKINIHTITKEHNIIENSNDMKDCISEKKLNTLYYTEYEKKDIEKNEIDTEEKLNTLNCTEDDLSKKENIEKGQVETNHESDIYPVKSFKLHLNDHFEDIDITTENIEFEQLSPSSPRTPVAEESLNTSQIEALNQSAVHCNLKMTDLMEKFNQQQGEISDLKLKLNAAQQHNASLELQIRQNEEIVIKTQAEALRTEQNYQQEVKQLKEKLNENSKIIEKDRIEELEEQIKDSKAKEAKLLAEISQKTKDDVNYQKIMEQYEISLKSRLAEFKKLQENYETTRNHLTNLELAFSDVHSKYEKTKASLLGLKDNEDMLIADLKVAQATNIQHEERYESLKAHARTQIEKSNKDIHTMKEHHEIEINKLKAFIRRLEIKVSSLEVSLQQKSEECEQLSALCDEVTGKQV